MTARPPTLGQRIESETGLDIEQFSQIVGLSRSMLQKMHTENRLALKLLLSGYKHEVKR